MSEEKAILEHLERLAAALDRLAPPPPVRVPGECVRRAVVRPPCYFWREPLQRSSDPLQRGLRFHRHGLLALRLIRP